MNPLTELRELGQSVWLDFLSRRFIAEGGLARLIAEDGLGGVTANPAIFEKAIDSGADYDPALAEALSGGDRDAVALYEGFAITDLQAAADLLRPVYDRSERADGFASLEVSPYIANDTEATIAEARRLWQAVGRENLMIKVPATRAGLPAIRQLLGEGINVNITLLFSQMIYEEVVEAFLAGAETFAGKGGDLRRLASVASFFVSRIDTAVDRLIDERLQRGDGAQQNEVAGLRGKVAIANAKLAYRRYQRRFQGARWEQLRARGARPQRLLWASTGTKDPAYSDVLYIEELIGRDTVNTMPPATMDAFRQHGKMRQSLEEKVGQAERVLQSLERAGISLEAVTDKLTEEGVRLFSDAADKLLGAIARKRMALLGKALDSQAASLPATLQKPVDETLEAWRAAGNVRRLWARDATLWSGGAEAQWLGWLDSAEREQAGLDDLRRFAAEIRGEGFTHALILGMGGSSLGPEVLARTFGNVPDAPELLVLDSTDPRQIRSFERRIDPARTLFIVSSKSGTTLEPNILMQYFLARANAALGAKAGRHFIAITDPGSKLEEAAERHGFRRVFSGVPSIGGRYSVLSAFGLVPAAVMGLDVARLLAATEPMVRSCDQSVPPADNPGVVLGTILGVAAKAGRDKVTILASTGLADFGTWLEQLLAESTGKHGKGLIPVDAEPQGVPGAYGQDRVFVALRLAAESDGKQDDLLGVLERAGHPVVRIVVTEQYHLGQEFFRWEMATAVAGAILGIDPFDQPDVEASKVKTRELTDAHEKSGRLPQETPFLAERGIKLFADRRNAEALAGAARGTTLGAFLSAHLARLGVGDYCAILAYIERSAPHQAALQEIRALIRDKKRVATCLGFGPRFLHSTGQAYKGGPNSGVFLQITCDDPEELAVPGQKYGFGLVKAAQARGDFEVLAERGRRALRIHLGPDVATGLASLHDAVRSSLG